MKMSANEELGQVSARVRSVCYGPIVSIGMTRAFLARLAIERAASPPGHYFKTWRWKGIPIQKVRLAAGNYYFDTGVFNKHRWL